MLYSYRIELIVKFTIIQWIFDNIYCIVFAIVMMFFTSGHG